MLKLIKLEWKKNKIGRYIRNAIILTIILTVFVYAMAYLGIARDPETGVPDTAPGHNQISDTIEMFTSIVYLIFTSVMLSSFIISSYKNKTMALMFSYPMKRQKILISQMLSVWIFGFLSLSITKLIIYVVIQFGSYFGKSDFPLDFNLASPLFYSSLLLKSVVIVTMSFISLFIGLAMRSSKAAIISSFLLILLTQANIGDFTLANSMVFPIVIIVISLIFAFLSICTAETKDLC